MNEILLPCPFCGGEAEVGSIPVLGGGNLYCFVECLNENCNGSSGQHDTESEAIAAWNRRAQPENKPLTLSELYDIDNEPLYFHCTVGHWGLNGWHIVKAINYDGAQFKDVQLDNNVAHIESLYNYGITWLAYRREPKEELHETD